MISKLSNPIERRDKNPFRNLAFRLATARRWSTLHGLVVCSEGQAEEIQRQVRPQIPVTGDHQSHTGCARRPMPPPREKYPASSVPSGAGTAEDYPLLLKAFALLRDLPLTLRIAGDGNLRVELQAPGRAARPRDRVEFLLTVDNVVPLMAESEALLLSSDYEASSAVCVEALAAGTFVIARDCGPGVREILRVPHTGRIVASDQPQALAAAIRDYWTARHFDATAARSVAANHVIGPIAERYLQLQDSAAETRRQGMTGSARLQGQAVWVMAKGYCLTKAACRPIRARSRRLMPHWRGR